MIRTRLHPQLDQGTPSARAFIVPQLCAQEGMHARVFPVGGWALDDPPFHEFGIVLEAHVKVLLAGNGHDM
jgi:hypothetical protein